MTLINEFLILPVILTELALRKHKLNPFPADKDGSDSLDEEYSKMLRGIERLAAVKQQEGRE